MFIHLCETCGNIAQKIAADFEHVCHICHERIVAVRDLSTGELVHSSESEPVAESVAETAAEPVAETVADNAQPT